MYSRFQLAKKYLHYYLTASNGKGHGIHSPFVFDFIKNVLRDKKIYDCYNAIEAKRRSLISRKEIIDVEDHGAGSSVIKTNKRSVSGIARSSLKPAKYAQLLYRIVNHYQPPTGPGGQTILELGTSFGISASYLAAGNTRAKVYTLEGSPAIAGIARENFEQLNIKNIELVQDDFSIALPAVLAKLDTIDLAFIDGNHRAAPTMNYFQQLVQKAGPATILIFDDIHWSAGMEAAWAEIRQHPSITLTIDLFFIGIVFFNPDINHKQHFSIRF